MRQDVFHKFIECTVPVTACNFRCHYCYVGQTQDESIRNQLPRFEYAPEQVAKALSQERLGGICCVNMCGAGETLLPPEMPSMIKAILGEGHYAMVVSNMVLTKRIDEILIAPREHLERLFIKCSFHYLELKRLELLECFASNIQKIRQSGCSFSVEITPCDELLPHVEDIKKFSFDHFCALPHVTVARDESKKNDVSLPILTKLSKLEYEKTWKEFSSELFEFKYENWGKKIKDFCYAGRWGFTLNLCNGEAKQCYSSDRLLNIFKDPTAPLVELPVGSRCREPHCYNGHAFLTFGLVPSMQTPTYADMRDRACRDGSHWLTPRMQAFFSQKLYKNNTEYSQEEKERFRQDSKKCVCQEENNFHCHTKKVSFLKLLGYKIRAPFSKRIRKKLEQLKRNHIQRK